MKSNGQLRTTMGKGGFLTKNINQNDILEVYGKSANIKFERKLDKKYRKHQAAIQIQRIWRGGIARTRVDNQKM